MKTRAASAHHLMVFFYLVSRTFTEFRGPTAQVWTECCPTGSRTASSGATGCCWTSAGRSIWPRWDHRSVVLWLVPAVQHQPINFFVWVCVCVFFSVPAAVDVATGVPARRRPRPAPAHHRPHPARADGAQRADRTPLRRPLFRCVKP